VILSVPVGLLAGRVHSRWKGTTLTTTVKEPVWPTALPWEPGQLTYEPGWAGPVRIRRPGYYSDGKPLVDNRPAYTKSERNTIIRQGRDHPRPLSAEEMSLAARNRRQNRGDLDAAEAWYASQCRAPGAKRRGRAG
jgi:hypothetical protein